MTHLMEHAAERRMIRLHHAVLVMLQPQGLERAALERRPADAGADLDDPQRALARGRQHAVATGLALAVFPSRRFPSHAPPPGGPCSGSPRPPQGPPGGGAWL